MNAVARVASALPTPLSLTLDCELRRLTCALEGEGPIRTLPVDRAPGQSVREALRTRQAQLDRWLLPAGPNVIDREIGTLFLLLKCKAFSDEQKPAILRLYRDDLRDLPAFAVEAACRAVRRREDRGDGWVPDSGHIRQLALDRVRGFVAERRQIAAVLSARIGPPIASPEVRAKAARAARELCAAMTLARPPNERAAVTSEPRRQPERPEEMASRLGREPLPKLSLEARQKMGLSEGQPDRQSYKIGEEDAA